MGSWKIVVVRGVSSGSSLKVYLGHGVARGISSRQSGKHSDLSMERERLGGREAFLICSASPFLGVGGSVTHQWMVEWYESYDCICNSSV